jgi:hypothetical protein
LGEVTKLSWIRNTIVGVSGVGIVSAGVLGFDATVRNDSGEIVESGALGVFSMQVGDCINDIDFGASEISEGLGVPCSEPHVYEVYYETFLEGLDLESIKQMADEECLSGFESYVGVPFKESALYYSVLFPSPESYDEGDREITCLLVTEDGSKLTGSMRGSGY